MGFDSAACDGIFGAETEAALRDFQRNVGLAADGTCGPATFTALDQLRRTVIGGRPHALREEEQLRRGGPHAGRQAWSSSTPVTAATTAAPARHDLAEADDRLRPGRPDRGPARRARRRRVPTRGPTATCPTTSERASFANATGADLLHLAAHRRARQPRRPRRARRYYYGTATGIGHQLRGRRAARRAGAARDRRPHRPARLPHPPARPGTCCGRTRMPAVRIEVGYLTNPGDAARLADPSSATRVAEAVVAAVQRLYLPPSDDADRPARLPPSPALLGRHRRRRDRRWTRAVEHAGRSRAQAFRGHRAEQALQRDLDVLAPGRRVLQLQPQPGVAVVRPHRLEADREQVVGRQHAVAASVATAASPKASIALHAAPGQVLRDALHEHPAQAAAGELRQDLAGHQQRPRRR